jgi:hypothetical protein
VLGLLVVARRDTSAAERWMQARRAEGEKFTLTELGLEHRPPLSCPVMEVLEGAQGTLGRFHSPAGPSEAFVGEPPPGYAHVLWQQTHMESQAHYRASWALMQDQLSRVEPELARLRVVLQTIVPDPGGSYTDFSVRLNFVAVREAANVLADATVIELHREQPDQALTNLVSLIHLGRQYEEHRHLVTQMIRGAVTRLALDMTWQALQRPGWTDEQLEMLQAELAECSLLDPMSQAIELERAIGLRWHAVLERGGRTGLARMISGAPTTAEAGALDRLQTLLWRRFWSDDDLLFFLQTHQANLEAVRRLSRGEAWAPLLGSLDEANDSEAMLTRGFFGFQYRVAWLTALALPNYRVALDHSVQTETRRRLALTAIALQRHRQRHGQWPTELESLVPESIVELPLDPYSASPFRYRIDVQGSPWLYSVGTNGEDDGGNANPNTESSASTSQPRTLDLLWPRALKPEEPNPAPPAARAR